MKIGSRLRGGETIELVSDLGGGKTTFVRGLAEGVGSSDSVRSPSFTIGNLYRARELTLHHFDFHRLEDPGIIRRELAEALEDPKAVVAAEWADTVRSVLPAKRLTVRITATGEDTRSLNFSYPAELDYLLKDQD